MNEFYDPIEQFVDDYIKLVYFAVANVQILKDVATVFHYHLSCKSTTTCIAHFTEHMNIKNSQLTET